MINNLKILDENPHLLAFVKQSKAEIEITNLPAFNYSLGRNRVCETYSDMFIIKDNMLIIDDEMVFTSVKTYVKEDAYKLSETSKKIILYLDFSKPMEKDHYRFITIEDIEESFKSIIRRKLVDKLKIQGRRKTYASRTN
jgi:hypothetical protein